MHVCMYMYVCMYVCMYVFTGTPICRDKITTPTIFLHASDENWGNNISSFKHSSVNRFLLSISRN